MSDPQTFEELRRMARELPKNVLVPAQHIHSLLDETERLVELSVDLKRQIAEEKEKLTEAKQIIASCERGGELLADDLDKAKAEIEAMRPIVDAARYHERSVTFYSHGTSSDPYHCDVCRAYKVYEARKQP